ncbi:TPA: hypothetical protein ACH3X2_004979 [Trebouxia sp. C0005]
MLPSDVLNEPLFFNKQISQPATSPAAINTACPAAAASFPTPQQKPLMLSAGITKALKGSAHQFSQLDSPLYLQGPLWGQHHLSLGVWGWGSQPAHQLVVKQAGLRLRFIRSFATKHPLAPGGLTCRPRLLPMPASGQSVAETLQAIEVRWVAFMQPSSRGTARLSSEVSASLPAWMNPSQTPRVHWSDRQQQRQEQHQQQTQQQPATQLPLEEAAANDTIDVLEACGSHAQQAHWQRT